MGKSPSALLGHKSVDICCRVHHDENMNDALTPPMTRPVPYGLTHDQLEFEPLTITQGPDYELDRALYELHVEMTKPEQHRIFEAALALYEKVCHDNTYDFTDRADLMAKCLHTAMIWERG